jgi:predicted nucleotidyltransferase component of viral defense system
MQSNDALWHKEVLDEAVEQTLKELLRAGVLGSFYLAGGTGLALYLGHRRSVDLDFFKTEAFDQEALLERLQQIPGLALVAKGAATLHTMIQGTKTSFLGYDYPILYPFGSFHGIQVADLRDIAGMKISAVASRGTRRDFIDLYVVSQKYGLDKFLQTFREKFAKVNYSMVHVLKSLTYFEDAEQEPMPDMLVPLAWDEVKQFFCREVPPFLGRFEGESGA